MRWLWSGREESSRASTDDHPDRLAGLPSAAGFGGRTLDAVLHGELDWHTPAWRYDGTPFTARGFERVPALERLQGWLLELYARMAAFTSQQPRDCRLAAEGTSEPSAHHGIVA